MVLGAVSAAAADGQQLTVSNQPVRIEEIVVTAQKRAENIQDVPIAVTALSQTDLKVRSLDGGPDILTAIPNVTFSKTNFTSYNLQIRGVGTQLISGNADSGVGIHENNAPLSVSRFFEAEFYDMDRIEVLRGPQGTVYGRNATGGVFNAITAKPTNKLEGEISAEAGNYDSVRYKGMLNLPLGEMFAFRVAGLALHRGGFITDTVYNNDVDGRRLLEGRATLSFTPNEKFHGFLLFEHFDEDDNRQRTGAQMCTKDIGPASVGGVATTNAEREFLSQGCLPVSIYGASARQTINSSATLGGLLANLDGLQSGDAFAGKTLSSDLRSTESYILPEYRARSDLVELNMELNLTDQLALTSLTSWNRDYLSSKEDYNRALPSANFNPEPGFLTDSGGNFTDPQLGTLNHSAAYDMSFSRFKQWTSELRLQSAFDGPFNFNAGAIYIDLNSPVDGGYYVVFNTGTAYAQCYNLGPCHTDAATGAPLGVPAVPIYIDPNKSPTSLGHNYYLNQQAYDLRSVAGFSELVWRMTDTFKWTLGLRYTDDRKNVLNYPVEVETPGSGFPTVPLPGQPSSAIYPQQVTFHETTGRFGADWKWADRNLLYAFFSRGYKAGGFNPAQQGSVDVNQSFAPEFVNALEVGSKNSLLNGKLTLNATAFYYDYKGYQISRVVNLTTVTDNVDAKIHGLEVEAAWQPFQNLRVDANVGYLRTRITDGSSVDVMNRTQGDPNLTLVKSEFTATNCVIPTAVVAQILQTAPSALGILCPEGLGQPLPNGLYATVINPGATFATLEGVPVDLHGKELPNSPHWTLDFGAQQSWNLNGRWTATLRGDYYYQSSSYARVYNAPSDGLQGWSNVNLALDVANPNRGWDVLLRVKNLFDKTAITGSYLTDDTSGLWINAFLNDPRLYTLAVTKKF
jgi:outer membrane receptor protein involved in Fe transport